MPIHVVEYDTSLGYRCLCSECGSQGEVSHTPEEAIIGFFPATPHEAFASRPETAVYLCANCHLQQLGEDVPSPEEVEAMLVDHVGRRSPDISLAPGSVARLAISLLAYGREMTNGRLIDQFEELHRISPEARGRLEEVYRDYLESERRYIESALLPPALTSVSPDLGTPKCITDLRPPTPVPLPEWCVEGALVRNKAGAALRIRSISPMGLLLDGNVDEPQSFVSFLVSRHEFMAVFFPSPPPSAWELLLQEGEDDLFSEDVA